MKSLKHLICIANNCGKPHHCKGYCKRHYERWKYGGDPNKPDHIRFKHGLNNHPLYHSWAGMRARCNNKNHVSYSRYGGRGIKVCDRWQNFSNFVKDMGERPEGMSLDRIDVNGNYEPSNCKWATRNEQARNICVPPDNKLGFTGITERPNGRYLVRIGFGGRRNHVGVYATLEEAKLARKEAEAKYWS